MGGGPAYAAAAPTASVPKRILRRPTAPPARHMPSVSTSPLLVTKPNGVSGGL